MIVQIILILCILQSNLVFATVKKEEEKAKKTAVEVVEKQVLLNQIYQELWQRVRKNQVPVDFGKISLIQLLAALFERYTAIRMNLLCWRCALYYKLGKGKLEFSVFLSNKANTKKKRRTYPSCFYCTSIQSVASKAEKCALMGQTFSWYNQQFLAEMFINAYDRLLSDTPTHELPEYHYSKLLKNKNKELGGLTIYEVAEKIDHVRQRLEALNQTFIDANLNYEDIFETLENNSEYLDEEDASPIEETGQEFYAEASIRLAKFLGEDYLAITRYISSVIKLPGVYYAYRDLLTSLDYAKKHFKHIQQTDEIRSEYSEIEKILSFEKESFLIPLTMKNLKIPQDLSIENFEIRPDMTDDSDYKLVKQSDEN